MFSPLTMPFSDGFRTIPSTGGLLAHVKLPVRCHPTIARGGTAAHHWTTALGGHVQAPDTPDWNVGRGFQRNRTTLALLRLVCPTYQCVGVGKWVTNHPELVKWVMYHSEQY